MIVKGSSPNFTSNIKEIGVNQLTFIPPKIISKLSMISVGIEFN